MGDMRECLCATDNDPEGRDKLMQEGEGSIGGKALRRCNRKSGTQWGRWPR